jgi:outer membrane protein
MRLKQQISAWLRLVGAAVVAASVFASGLGVSASEQTPAAQTPAQPAPAPQVPGGTLRIGQDEAVKLALENNLGIQTERLNPRIQELAVSRALAAYSPVIGGSMQRNSRTSPPSDFLSQGVAVTTNAGVNGSVGVLQELPFGGGNYQVGINGFRTTNDAPRTPFSPQLTSDLSFVYNQPLLRDFKVDALRQQVMQSRNLEEVADIQLAQRITVTSRAVRNGYLNLVAAISGLQVAEQSLDLARQALKNNQRRVEVGTMAPIDIVAAEAEVARNEENVIVQQGNIEAAQDALRTLILNPSSPDFWNTRIEPSEQPVLTPQPIDVDGAIRNALSNRTDLGQLRKQIEADDINIKFNANQRLPGIDFQARYGLSGLGGTLREFDPNPPPGLPPSVINSSQRSFAEVLRDVFGNDFRNWTVSVNVSYPLGTSQADASLAQSRLSKQQGEVQRRDLETEIARQVRDAGRQVSTSLKRVEATRKARELAERSLEAEEKRLAVGLSDSFRLFQFQRDLSNARSSELNAIISYNRALINFEAVQVVPGGGGGGPQ